MLREQLTEEIEAAARDAAALPPDAPPPRVILTAAADPAAQGDYRAEVPPGLAEAVAARLTERNGLVASARVGGDGRISLRLRPDVLAETLRGVLTAGDNWGRSRRRDGERVLFEFVSANPNAPLSVSHGRGGAVGDALAALFHANGAHVQREFYVNDAEDARPLRTFARAVLARYRERCGVHDRAAGSEDDAYPAAGYVAELADALYAARGDAWAAYPNAEALPLVQRFALERMEADQRTTLDALNIFFDEWFSERMLRSRGAIRTAIETLVASGQAEKRQDGSVWLRSSRLGDESDRALIRADGSETYLAGDLAYHGDKFGRGFDRLVDVWSADHAAYVARTRAGLSALGLDPARLDVVLVQPVRLVKDGTEVKGSPRYGGAPTLAELLEQVGPDTARFALLLKPMHLPLDLDLDAAARSDSPLARVRAAIARARHAGGPPDADAAGGASEQIAALVEGDTAARALLLRVAELPGAVRQAADTLAPHHVGQYAVELADGYLAFPDRDTNADDARRALAQSVGIALENALALLGVSGALPVHAAPPDPATSAPVR
jgi:arginyl-tRNA synthetase